MAVEVKSYSVDVGVDETISRLATKFGLSKSRIASELLRRSIAGLLESDRFEFFGLNEEQE